MKVEESECKWMKIDESGWKWMKKDIQWGKTTPVEPYIFCF